MSAPAIAIYVRHGKDAKGNPCKYAGDEYARRCDCPKHFRWTQDGTRHRMKAGTRSWVEAEEKRRKLEDELSSKPAGAAAGQVEAKPLRDAVAVFISEKTTQGVDPSVLQKYRRELDRLREFIEARGDYAVQSLTRETLTAYAATWAVRYPSTQTRACVRQRLRAFLRYCYEAMWLARVPSLTPVKIDVPPTMPLTAREYAALLEGCRALPFPEPQVRARAAFQLMRWSGLAIRDALTLPTKAIRYDERRRLYKVTTARQKTGTPVEVAIPADVAAEVLAVAGAEYVFWDGKQDIVKSWTKYVVAPAFKAACIPKQGSMLSHRLRDTFAVDLLEKGVPMEEVSKALGHTSIKTTEKHYAKWVQARQDRLDNLISGTWTPQPEPAELRPTVN